jgi:hypothetical protein
VYTGFQYTGQLKCGISVWADKRGLSARNRAGGFDRFSYPPSEAARAAWCKPIRLDPSPTLSARKVAAILPDKIIASHHMIFIQRASTEGIYRHVRAN